METRREGKDGCLRLIGEPDVWESEQRPWATSIRDGGAAPGRSMAPSRLQDSLPSVPQGTKPGFGDDGGRGHNSSLNRASDWEMAQTVHVQSWKPARHQKAAQKALYKVAPGRLLKTRTPSTYNIDPVTGEPMCIGASKTPVEDQSNRSCTASGGGKPGKQVSKKP